MKKMISMVLALALCLMLVPAVAEEASVVGTWYLSRAESSQAAIDVVDPEGIVFVFAEDGTCDVNIKAYGATQEGTWKQEGSSVTITIQDQAQTLELKDGDLVYSMGGSTAYLSRTPGEAVAIPALIQAESAEAFNGRYIAVAQLSTGLYAVIPEEMAASMGILSIENGKASVLVDGTAMQETEFAFENGVMTAEDNSVLPIKSVLTLMENGNLCFTTIIEQGGMSVEMSYIYAPCEAVEEAPAA